MRSPVQLRTDQNLCKIETVRREDAIGYYRCWAFSRRRPSRSPPRLHRQPRARQRSMRGANCPVRRGPGVATVAVSGLHHAVSLPSLRPTPGPLQRGAATLLPISTGPTPRPSPCLAGGGTLQQLATTARVRLTLSSSSPPVILRTNRLLRRRRPRLLQGPCSNSTRWRATLPRAAWTVPRELSTTGSPPSPPTSG